MRQPSKETVFVRKHAKKPTPEIIALGKAAGLTLDPKKVNMVKYNAKKAKPSSALKAAPKSKSARPDPDLVRLILARGADRVEAALNFVRSNFFESKVA